MVLVTSMLFVLSSIFTTRWPFSVINKSVCLSATTSNFNRVWFDDIHEHFSAINVITVESGYQAHIVI